MNKKLTGIGFADEYESTTHDIKFSWEEIAYTGYSKTWRAMVFGGWIVRSVRFQISGSSDDRATATESSVFIPDPQHEWLMEPDERLNIKVKDLDLSVRARHCLRLNEIVTIGDLVSLTEYDLLKFNNFGKKSLAELKQVLGQYDLALKPRGVRVLEFHNNNKEEK